MTHHDGHRTLLARWKELAKIENKRARERWGGYLRRYTPPEAYEPPEVTAARQQRDDQIVAWHADGASTAEIARRTGLMPGTVARILRTRRLAEQEADQ